MRSRRSRWRAVWGGRRCAGRPSAPASRRREARTADRRVRTTRHRDSAHVDRLRSYRPAARRGRPRRYRRAGGRHRAIEPNAVVNCAAFHNVDQCEAAPERALAVNALAVERAARACRDRERPLRHRQQRLRLRRDVDATVPSKTIRSIRSPRTASRSWPANCWSRPSARDALVVRTCGVYGAASVGEQGVHVRRPRDRAGARGRAAADRERRLGVADLRRPSGGGAAARCSMRARPVCTTPPTPGR